MVNKNKFKPVQSLGRGMRILEVVSLKKEGAYLKDIAEEIGCSSAAAYHLVHTLVEAGYVKRLEDPARYVLGGKVIQLAENQKKDRFYEVLADQMRALARELSGAVIYLSEYIGGNVVVRFRTDVREMDRIREEGNRMLPPYVSAGSFVHIAFWSQEVLDEYQSRYSLEVYGLRFWRTRSAFKKALTELREQGVYLMPEKSLLYLKLAVPVFRPGGEFAAALTIQWNQADVRDIQCRREELITTALRAGKEITERLGKF